MCIDLVLQLEDLGLRADPQVLSEEAVRVKDLSHRLGKLIHAACFNGGEVHLLEKCIKDRSRDLFGVAAANLLRAAFYVLFGSLTTAAFRRYEFGVVDLFVFWIGILDLPHELAISQNADLVPAPRDSCEHRESLLPFVYIVKARNLHPVGHGDPVFIKRCHNAYGHVVVGTHESIRQFVPFVDPLLCLVECTAVAEFTAKNAEHFKSVLFHHIVKRFISEGILSISLDAAHINKFFQMMGFDKMLHKLMNTVVVFRKDGRDTRDLSFDGEKRNTRIFESFDDTLVFGGIVHRIGKHDHTVIILGRDYVYHVELKHALCRFFPKNIRNKSKNVDIVLFCFCCYPFKGIFIKLV